MMRMGYLQLQIHHQARRSGRPRRLSHEAEHQKINKYRKELGKDLILFLANCGTTPHDSALHSNDSVSRGFDSRGSSMMRPTFNAQARPDKRTFPSYLPEVCHGASHDMTKRSVAANFQLVMLCFDRRENKQLH